MITAEKLSLRLTGLAGLEGPDAEQLAREVAARLAAARGFDTDGATLERGALAVTLLARPGESRAELAARIAGAILRALERSLG